jgi:thioredoxin
VKTFLLACLAACLAAGCSPKPKTPQAEVTGGAEKVDAAAYRQIIASEPRLVLVDFYADWCGPCKALAPRLEEVAAKRATAVRLLKVNVDENPALAQELGIQGIPYVAFYRGGKMVDTMLGLESKEAIEEKVKARLGS